MQHTPETIAATRLPPYGETEGELFTIADRENPHRVKARVEDRPLPPTDRSATGDPAERAVSWPLSNSELAKSLEMVADVLEGQEANVFRVRAYRTAAEILRKLAEPAREILQREGVDGLMKLPGIGKSLARSLEQLCRTGHLGLLRRLRGSAWPEQLFMTLPGIGLEFASRIHEQLGLETLEDLETAAHDGRLEQITGMGGKRLRAIRESLALRLRRPRPAALPPRTTPLPEPAPVAELLDIDREYRAKAHAGKLPLIAPRRFNPTGKAWLPVLHTTHGDRHCTALYSNTARAHELHMTGDWVVVFRDDHDGHGQWTIVTARFGALRDRRIVRGREAECAAYCSERSERTNEPTSLRF